MWNFNSTKLCTHTVYSLVALTLCCSALPCTVHESSCYSSASFYSPNAYGNFPNGTSLNIGYVVSCINNTEHVVCSNGLGEHEAQLVCRAIGGYTVGHSTPLFGSREDFRPPLRNGGAYDISCPSYSSQFNTYDCNITSTTGGCVSEAALITCVDGR